VPGAAGGSVAATCVGCEGVAAVVCATSEWVVAAVCALAVHVSPRVSAASVMAVQTIVLILTSRVKFMNA